MSIWLYLYQPPKGGKSLWAVNLGNLGTCRIFLCWNCCRSSGFGEPGEYPAPWREVFPVLYWALRLGEKSTVRNNSVRGKPLWPVRFLLDVATNIFPLLLAHTAAFLVVHIWLTLISSTVCLCFLTSHPQIKEISPLKPIFTSWKPLWEKWLGITWLFFFSRNGCGRVPSYREIDSECGHLPSVLDLLKGFAITFFPSFLRLPLKKDSYFFS